MKRKNSKNTKEARSLQAVVGRVLKARAAIEEAENERDDALWLLIKPFIGAGRVCTPCELGEWLKKRGGVEKLLRGKGNQYVNLAWDCINAANS